ncbi:hypothetical protein K0M31_006447 [Melipona bicolor]|uniref:Uncharacterized protein n=1 Tax=Melipona bicolor TaxID=60889 RepID=A0AA40FTL2_9HYME|nr:hypothetical protein K0M31_006447 [Melipona bicolor]
MSNRHRKYYYLSNNHVPDSSVFDAKGGDVLQIHEVVEFFFGSREFSRRPEEDQREPELARARFAGTNKSNLPKSPRWFYPHPQPWSPRSSLRPSWKTPFMRRPVRQDWLPRLIPKIAKVDPVPMVSFNLSDSIHHRPDELTTNRRIIAVTVDVNRLKGDLRRERVVTRNDEFINWVPAL